MELPCFYLLINQLGVLPTTYRLITPVQTPEIPETFAKFLIFKLIRGDRSLAFFCLLSASVSELWMLINQVIFDVMPSISASAKQVLEQFGNPKMKIIRCLVMLPNNLPCKNAYVIYVTRGTCTNIFVHVPNYLCDSHYFYAT